MKPHSCKNSFSQLLQKIKKKQTNKQKTIITGDFHLNLLNYAKNIGTHEFLESIFSNNLTPQICLPTRITRTSSTLINNILINSQENVDTSGNFIISMCDHVPHFTIIENLLIDTLVKKTSQSFIVIISLEMSNHIVSVDRKQPKQCLEKYMLIINNLLDKYAPFKEQVKRKEKLRFKP